MLTTMPTLISTPSLRTLHSSDGSLADNIAEIIAKSFQANKIGPTKSWIPARGREAGFVEAYKVDDQTYALAYLPCGDTKPRYRLVTAYDIFQDFSRWFFYPNVEPT